MATRSSSSRARWELPPRRWLVVMLLAALLVPSTRVAPTNAQDQEWDWAGEWTTVEHVGWIQGYMTIERLDVDLAEFEVMLPTWAYGLRGLCWPIRAS